MNWQIWLCLVGVFLNPAAGLPADDLAGPWFGGILENDLVVRTDRHYTQGLKLTFMSGEVLKDSGSWFASWSEGLPDFGGHFRTARYGLSVGQNIYTPKNIAATNLQTDDRPYAGHLYSALMLQRRGETGAGRPVLDHWQIDLGIIGPESLAEEAQNTVHRLRNFGLANGWSNQVKTEPGIAVKYQRTWRCSAGHEDGFSGQLLPHAGVSMGNTLTCGALGGQARFGWRLPTDFGVRGIDSIVPGSGGLNRDTAPSFGAYAFMEVEGRALAYNAYLDGGLFHGNHHVTSHPLVGDVKLGVAFVFRRCDLTYTQVARTKEFVGQKEADAFGSLALRFKW